MQNPSQSPPVSSKVSNMELKDMDVFCTFKSRYRANTGNVVVSITSDHICIKMQIPNPGQQSPASFKAPNEDLKDMDVLSTFKTKIENPKLEHGCFKDH